MSILVTKYSVRVLLFLDYSTHKVHLLPNFKSVLCTEGEILISFFQLQYTIHVSTIRLFINENSNLFKKCKCAVQCVCHYTAVKSWNLSLPQ